MHLTVDRDFLRMLVVQVRALMAKTAEDPDDGSNPTDDPTPELLALGVLVIGQGGRSHQDSALAIESE